MDPKVLILSENFIAGDAITGLNLFSKWDKRSKYIASRHTLFFYKNFQEGYLIGDKEIRFRFPFKLFNKVPKSRVVNCEAEKPSQKRHAGKLLSKLYLELVVPFMKWLGVFSYRASYLVSDQFLQWVDELSPECVYSSVGSLNMAEFVHSLMINRPNLKYIIHGYDDWPEPNYYTITSAYTKRSLTLLDSIMSQATLTFSTTEKMAEDYAKRYKREFLTYPNPVEKLVISSENLKHQEGITFVGKILNHNLKSILLLESALAKSDLNITLHIYSEVRDNIRKEILSKYKNTIIHGWVDHDEIKKILINSRILYLPISIDKQTKKFTRYSMSTKMSEYLSSGVPVLYHGPSGIAMTEMLEKHRCAFIVKENKEDSILSAIREILEDNEKSKIVLKNAQSLFFDKFEKEKV